MKLFHTSDWHLGRMLYARSLLEDQRAFLEGTFLPAVAREKPACVLLCGDVYDRQIAAPGAIQLFDETLARLLELGSRVCVISGNHDGARRLAVLKPVLRRSGAVFATQLEDALDPVLLEEDGVRVQLFPLPYFEVAEARQFLGEPELKNEGACMEALIRRMESLFEPGAAHILLAHCFAAGSTVSDSESGLFVGGSGGVPTQLFEAFDYAALGHLHAPQKAGNKARYSGSPLKYSVDEQHQKKGFTVVDWDGTRLTAEERPVTPLRDVRRLEKPFRELLEGGRACPVEDYVELVLTDREPILMAAQQLQPYYPNLLAVSNPWAVSGVAGQRARALQGQDQRTVFVSFCRDVCGFEPEEGDLELFDETLKEVWS